MKIRMINALTLIISLIGISTQASELEPPVGVRPCCAFGKDLKANVAGITVPFFSVGNILTTTNIGSHTYNDGSNSVSASLLGLADEKNGIIFTKEGGFIDTAHVRDTADYTYYLFHENKHFFGTDQYIELTDELRTRRIQWQAHDESTLTPEQILHMQTKSAALMAFRLAQWHEIAQWFGMTSVGGFDELASAFSSEDLYSNMLGALLASEILNKNPELNSSQFTQEMDIAFNKKLIELKAQPKYVTDEIMEELDGTWWDSTKSLPDKWAVIFRDYKFRLTLTPNYKKSHYELTLPSQFCNGDNIEDWVHLELHKSHFDKHFRELSNTFTHKKVWFQNDFQKMADFAQRTDKLEYQQILAAK